MQNWKKLGLIFDPTNRFDWMVTHATVPTPLHLYDDIFRIYFSTRNSLNHNQVGYIEIDINNPFEILKISEKPVIGVGELGMFDCDGIYGTCIVPYENKLYFYYAGWNAGLRGLFNSALGLAISEDGGQTFEKLRTYPIMHRSEHNPWAAMAPFVMKEEGLWRMWYASGEKMFLNDNGILKSNYDIKYAESVNGIDWNQTGIISIPLAGIDSNIARPCVIKEDGIYKVWYPHITLKDEQYRIGYGESKDGIVFERLDFQIDMPIAQNENDFDNRAVTYPFVFEHKSKKYMFYNGNEFGKAGIGLAILN
jgi:hypothetical protein